MINILQVVENNVEAVYNGVTSEGNSVSDVESEEEEENAQENKEKQAPPEKKGIVNMLSFKCIYCTVYAYIFSY